MERHPDRTIDGLGRIVLSNEIRAKLSWEPGDKIAVYKVDKNTIILQSTEKNATWESKAIFLE